LSDGVPSTVVFSSASWVVARHGPVRDVGSDLVTNLDFSHSLGCLKTGASWFTFTHSSMARFDGRIDRQIERRACRYLSFHIPGRASLSNGTDWHRSDCSRRRACRYQGLISGEVTRPTSARKSPKCGAANRTPSTSFAPGSGISRRRSSCHPTNAANMGTPTRQLFTVDKIRDQQHGQCSL
jgi:hypothetical protein